MRAYRTSLGLAAVMLAGGAGSAAGAAGPPDLVAAYTSQLAQQCGPVASGVAPSLVDRLDLNGDGKLDIVVDASRYPCPTRPAVFAERGYPVTIFLQSPSGQALPAFQRTAYGAHLQRAASGGVSLWLTMGGGDCGDTNLKARCERQVVWRSKDSRLELVEPPRAAAR